MGQELKQSRKRLARIRCLKECIECFKHNRPLPAALCYIPAEAEYMSVKPCKLVLQQEAGGKPTSPLGEVACESLDRIFVSGETVCNSTGQWCRYLKSVSKSGEVTPLPENIAPGQAWMLLFSSQNTHDDAPSVIPARAGSEEPAQKKNGLLHITTKPVNTWEDMVEQTYALHLGQPQPVAPSDQDAVARLQCAPVNWGLEHDEDVGQFLCTHTEADNETLGSAKNYVESIDVSSYSEDEGSENLTDGDTETYWESDGNQGQHWIRLRMKKGTIIKKLMLGIDGNDDNYMPFRIMAMAGDSLESLHKISDITVDMSVYNLHDVTVIEDQTEHFPVIEIRIKECKEDGIDTRIHGIKIRSSKERDLGLSQDLFSGDRLVRFPKLESFSADILYRRAQVLQRFVTLLDGVLPYIVPAWEYSVGSYASLEMIRQLLPLSKKRVSLIETFLRESETCRPTRMPKLYINRRAAAEHKADPGQDPDGKNTVFMQIYEGLKPRDRLEKPLDYRWPGRYDQWWECKFLAEGIIDQGGGFRDSLSDLADELCPTSSEAPVPLCFFIRSPNQKNADTNVNRDMYIPNPSCTACHIYEWIGQLMGACLRGKENLVLSLPSFVWKKLAGEHVTWSRDYVTVDEAQVKLTDHLASMDRETFDAYFSEERTWTTLLSDSQVFPLRPGDPDVTVVYEDRIEYACAVREARMSETNRQVEAMRKGLLRVVPQAVLDLLTWQELEKRICGDPEISVEALKRSTHYEDLEDDDTRVLYLWEALNNFSNEDRSRYLRFITGRRRLPAPIYICPDKGEITDGLPESSTCSNTLYLPAYSSAKVAEDKLRYAAYNCIAIDTDLSPWDESGSGNFI